MLIENVLNSQTVDLGSSRFTFGAVAGLLGDLPGTARAACLLEWAYPLSDDDLDPVTVSVARDYALAFLAAWVADLGDGGDPWALLLDRDINPVAVLAYCAAVVDLSFPAGSLSVAVYSLISENCGGEAAADLENAFMRLARGKLRAAIAPAS